MQDLWMPVKRLLLLATAVLASMSAYGQGQIIFSTQPNGPISLRPGQLVTLADGIVAQVYWSPVDLFNYQPVGPVQPVGATPGHVAATVVTFPQGVPGGTMLDLDVRVWESAYGATYEAATAPDNIMGGRTAISGAVRFTFSIGGPGGAVPLPPASIGGATPALCLLCIPEPSVISLGVLGAGVLLVARYRRR